MEAHTLHIWQANLRQIATPWWPLLSTDEQSRAQQFSVAQRRADFIVGRGILRTLLGQYLDQNPQDFQFSYGPQGKPSLSDPLQFNLAHSHGRALYAFALDTSLGVDLEKFRPVRMAAIVKRCFAPAEIAYFQTLAPEAWEAAFFTAWTRKEAYLKAVGTGLTDSLNQCPVNTDPKNPQFLEPSLQAKWSLFHLDLDQDYVGAVVAEGHRWQVKLLQFP